MHVYSLLAGPKLPHHVEYVGQKPNQGIGHGLVQVETKCDNVLQVAIRSCIFHYLNYPVVDIASVVATSEKGVDTVFIITRSTQGTHCTLSV